MKIVSIYMIFPENSILPSHEKFSWKWSIYKFSSKILYPYLVLNVLHTCGKPLFYWWHCFPQKFREIDDRRFQYHKVEKSLKTRSPFHTVEITEIYSHGFLAKISWKQRIHKKNNSRVDLTEKKFGESKYFLFPQCAVWKN